MDVIPAVAHEAQPRLANSAKIAVSSKLEPGSQPSLCVRPICDPLHGYLVHASMPANDTGRLTRTTAQLLPAERRRLCARSRVAGCLALQVHLGGDVSRRLPTAPDGIHRLKTLGRPASRYDLLEEIGREKLP